MHPIGIKFSLLGNPIALPTIPATVSLDSVVMPVPLPNTIQQFLLWVVNQRQGTSQVVHLRCFVEATDKSCITEKGKVIDTL